MDEFREAINFVALVGPFVLLCIIARLLEKIHEVLRYMAGHLTGD